jgi:inner membrane protein
LPTIITHSVIAVSAAYGFSSRKKSLKFFILSITCSILPDADVIGYLYLYIPANYFFGHRGFFHSPFFAALLSIFIVFVFYRKEGTFSNQWWKYALYFFIITSTHGLLDALTNGGNGIALLSPITNNRYFFPWTPIEVSPLGIKGFLTQRGLTVLTNELLWIWVPSFLTVIFLKAKRNKKKKEEIFETSHDLDVHYLKRR